MYWIELTADVPRHAADAVAALLFERGASGVHEVETRADRSRLRSHLLWSPQAEEMVKALRADLRQVRQRSSGSCRLRTRRISFVIPVGEGAVPSWCFDTPMPVVCPDEIGERIVVKDPRHPFTPRDDQRVVELVPTRAFGNGAHDTTRLCCRALERFLQPGDNVVDVGTGTGLLALAAARLGAGRVTAFDIEDEALRAARENVRQNRLDGVVSVLHADQMKAVARRMAGRVDAVVANLLPWVIEQITPDVKRMLRYRGRYVVSGLRADAVKALDLIILQHGLDVIDVSVEDEWCCLVYENLDVQAVPQTVNPGGAHA